MARSIIEISIIDKQPDHDEFDKLGNILLYLDENGRGKLHALQQIFIEEFNGNGQVQRDVLRMLVRQLVIITNLAKERYLSEKIYEGEKFELIKKYNILVDKYYKREHQVQFYAGMLSRSPKTICNLFAKQNYRKPSLIIHDRIIHEAKRLFYYTDKSDKEIAQELGFNDAGHFSRFFKKATNQCPSEFRISNKQAR